LNILDVVGKLQRHGQTGIASFTALRRAIRAR
jgi:hypothetical protein